MHLWFLAAPHMFWETKLTKQSQLPTGLKYLVEKHARLVVCWSATQSFGWGGNGSCSSCSSCSCSSRSYSCSCSCCCCCCCCVCCLLFVVCCLLFVVCCFLSLVVGCWLLVVGCWWLLLFPHVFNHIWDDGHLRVIFFTWVETTNDFIYGVAGYRGDFSRTLPKPMQCRGAQKFSSTAGSETCGCQQHWCACISQLHDVNMEQNWSWLRRSWTWCCARDML